MRVLRLRGFVFSRVACNRRLRATLRNRRIPIRAFLGDRLEPKTFVVTDISLLAPFAPPRLALEGRDDGPERSSERHLISGGAPFRLAPGAPVMEQVLDGALRLGLEFDALAKIGPDGAADIPGLIDQALARPGLEEIAAVAEPSPP